MQWVLKLAFHQLKFSKDTCLVLVSILQSLTPFLKFPIRNFIQLTLKRMGLKTKGSLTGREGPGPGDYNSNTIFKQIQGSVRFGREGRDVMRGEKDTLSKSYSQVPGPGSYKPSLNPKMRIDPRAVFTRA